MIRYFILILFILAQQLPGFAQNAKGKTYAVVIGISTYENLGDDQLVYADKDAQVFYNYLRSKAGGTVPEENIKLLLNKDASFSAIYDALHWLLETCGKNDMVYFYFSGHGDLENFTISQDGYLITYNTPRTNYVYNAVSIEYLNKVANTLSVRNNGKVILITDACHSGKLAGRDRGVYLVGEQLRTAQKNEIRLSSCSTDQLSNEDVAWGGGRGVFSYYLIKGLEGFADEQKDGIVTVSDIRNYMDSCLKTDNFLKKKDLKQTPVIQGVDQFDLSKVDNKFLDSVKKAGNDESGIDGLKPIAKKTQDYLFDLIQTIGPESLIDFNKLNTLSKEEIPFVLIRSLADSFVKRDYYNSIYYENAMKNLQTKQMAVFENKLHSNDYALGQFKARLVELLSDRGQDVINAYLNGDAAELERRRYYNYGNNGYDIYPQMFALALKLTAPENHLYEALQVKQHYFAGVVMRLKLPFVDTTEQKQLIEKALAEEQVAYGLQKFAAYIQNELGNIYVSKGDYDLAKKYYLEATGLSPAWVIPWANLVGVFGYKGMFKEALDAEKTARSLDPEFPGTYTNSGFTYEKTGNLLMAEEVYRKSIFLNSRHYLPFERLAYVYQQTTQYALADSFFYEADIRKKGMHPKNRIEVLPNTIDVMPPEPPFECFFDSSDVGKNDAMGHFAWGYLAYQNGNMSLAEKKFKETIAIDKSDPLAFHYLGELLYKQKRWEEADLIFNYAVNYYLDNPKLELHADSLSGLLPKSRSKECIAATYKHAAYNRINDHYYLGTAYEKWNHFYEAEKEYRLIMQMDSAFIGGYYKLWTMQETIGHFKDAEAVIRRYGANVGKTEGDKELAAFYKRATDRYPDNPEWFYNAGVFFYELVSEQPGGYKNDFKEIPADSKQAAYVLTLKESADFIQQFPFHAEKPATFGLPGIGEYGSYSGTIYFPRTDGINYLRKADSLFQQADEISADINYKIGDLYVWQHLPSFASAYYKKAVDLKPDDANTRIKLTDTYTATYKYQDALEQLDSLYNRKEINFPKQLMMAKYYIHSGKFTEAVKLLDDARKIHPYKIPEIYDLNGRLQLLSGKIKEALPSYKNNLLLDPDDSLTMYTIARIYAMSGNTDEAFKWLGTAIGKGFRYGWVLRADPAWDALRKNAQWEKLVKDIPQKSYAKHFDKDESQTN